MRNYLFIISSKLNLRDRTQLAIWAVQTGVTQKNFFQRKWINESKAIVSTAILFVLSCLSLFLIWENKQIKIIRAGFILILVGEFLQGITAMY